MKIFFCLCLLFSFSLAIFAAPFKPNRVPAKAKWYLHFDMDNFKNTNMGKELVAKALADPSLFQVNEILLLIGIEPLKNVKGVTFYGDDFKENNWLLVYEGNLAREKLLDLIKVVGSYEISNNNGVDVYKASTKDDKFYFFIDQDILYLSKKVSMINDHVQMIMGDEPFLKNDNSANKISLKSLSIVGYSDSLPDEGKDKTISELNSYIMKISGGVNEELKSIKSEFNLETFNSDTAEKLNNYLKILIGYIKTKNENSTFIKNALQGIVITKVSNRIIIKSVLKKEAFVALINQKDDKKNNNNKRDFPEDEARK